MVEMTKTIHFQIIILNVVTDFASLCISQKKEALTRRHRFRLRIRCSIHIRWRCWGSFGDERSTHLHNRALGRVNLLLPGHIWGICAYQRMVVCHSWGIRWLRMDLLLEQSSLNMLRRSCTMRKQVKRNSFLVLFRLLSFLEMNEIYRLNETEILTAFLY